MNKFTESTSKQLKYCNHCNSKLKEIVYEIIEPDKTTELDRHFCNKCSRVFFFRQSRPKPVKKRAKKVKSYHE